MTETALVKAVWSAGFPVVLPDGRELQPGDTHLIPAGELASDHWTAAQHAAVKPPVTAKDTD